MAIKVNLLLKMEQYYIGISDLLNAINTGDLLVRTSNVKLVL